MHEVSLCEDIRDILEAEAKTQGYERVTRIWLEVGPLSCVEPEALRFGFDAVMRGSVAEGAALDIASPPATARCTHCDAAVAVCTRYDPCPACGAPQLQVSGGDSLRINKVEVV